MQRPLRASDRQFSTELSTGIVGNFKSVNESGDLARNLMQYLNLRQSRDPLTVRSSTTLAGFSAAAGVCLIQVQSQGRCV